MLGARRCHSAWVVPDSHPAGGLIPANFMELHLLIAQRAHVQTKGILLRVATCTCCRTPRAHCVRPVNTFPALARGATSGGGHGRPRLVQSWHLSFSTSHLGFARIHAAKSKPRNDRFRIKCRCCFSLSGQVPAAFTHLEHLSTLPTCNTTPIPHHQLPALACAIGKLTTCMLGTCMLACHAVEPGVRFCARYLLHRVREVLHGNEPLAVLDRLVHELGVIAAEGCHLHLSPLQLLVQGAGMRLGHELL